MTDLARLLIDCPDDTGLVSAISGFIGAQGGNILEADQHTDPNEARFFMRVEFDRSRVTGGESGFVMQAMVAWTGVGAGQSLFIEGRDVFRVLSRRLTLVLAGPSRSRELFPSVNHFIAFSLA